MTPTSHVAIIGGGAMGCATAYYLAKAGVSSTIIESEGIATQASGYNAGGLNPLQGAGIPGPLSDIAASVLRNAQRPRPNPRRRIRRRVPPQDHRIRHRSLRRLRHPRHAGNPRHLRHGRRLQRPLARRIRPPRDGAAPQPRSPARHLRIRQRNPQRLRIHPSPRTRRRAQRRADTARQSSSPADRRRPRNRRNPRRR